MLNKINHQSHLIQIFTKKYVGLALLAVAVLLLDSALSYAGPPRPFRPGRTSFGFDLEYYWSTKNYDDEGESLPLGGNNEYKNYIGTINGRYVWTSQISTSAGLIYSNANSKTFNEDRSNGKLTGLLAEVEYLLDYGSFYFVPVINALITFDEIEESQDEVLTSEGVHIVTPGAWGVVRLGYVKGYGFLGVAIRDQERSMLLPWIAGLSYRWPNLMLSGEFNGFESISDDVDKDKAGLGREQLNLTVNGGSLKYYSVNPSVINAKIEGRFFANNQFSAGLAYQQALMGKNYAEGQSILFSLQYNFGLGEVAAPAYDRPVRNKPTDASLIEEWEAKNKKPNKNKPKDFTPAVESDYDESLFEE